MNIKDVAKLIRRLHLYYITPEYWGRVGSMCNRFGAETVFTAIEQLPTDSSNLDHLLNMAERKCQNSLRKDATDNIADILND